METTDSVRSSSTDLVIVGAGFAGMYMLHKARGLGLTSRVFEAGSDVGGTWYWNRYPGARCDIPSMEYSYSFDPDLQQEWEWTEKYAAQPEILRYAGHVADRFELRPGITFDTRVTSATYEEDSSRWLVTTDGDETVAARFLVTAVGCLSSTNLPGIAGIDSFAGPTYHTGRWPHDGVDFSGERVGLIGTGSSAVQSIPLIAADADHLTVFQRTPTYTIPAHNAPLDPAEVADIKADYESFRALNREQIPASGADSRILDESALAVDEQTRRETYDLAWERGGLFFVGAFNDLLFDRAANETAGAYVRDKISEIVDDPDIADRLMPDQVIGCKRLCVDTDYYATYNRPDVELVDISDSPIDEITPGGLRVADREWEFDAIVFATGFDAMTGSLLKMNITGRDGVALADAWDAGPRTYLGLGVVGFPNMFTITGPGSPSVLTNMMVSIEQHVEWIAGCIADIDANDLTSIEATPQAQDDWVDFVNAVADFTLYPHCNSWYLGSNVPGKTRVFMPLIGFPDYAAKCDEVAAAGYEGFVRT